MEKRYSRQQSRDVALQVLETAGTVAGRYASVSTEQRNRRGTRSNGSEFTIETLATYHVHELVHHLHDIGASLGD